MATIGASIGKVTILVVEALIVAAISSVDSVIIGASLAGGFTFANTCLNFYLLKKLDKDEEEKI